MGTWYSTLMMNREQEQINNIWELWETGYPGIDYPETFNPWEEIASILRAMQAMEDAMSIEELEARLKNEDE